MNSVNTVGIIGLGLIGGSMAKAVARRTDCVLYGTDASEDIVNEAVSDKVLQGRLEDHYADIDLLIVALYPADVVDIILETAPKLPRGCIVIDCTGVKQMVCSRLSSKLDSMGLRFIGGHPMAGKEVRGYANSSEELYDGASMILCRDEYTDEDAFAAACDFFHRLGFSGVKVTDAAEHDAGENYFQRHENVGSGNIQHVDRKDQHRIGQSQLDARDAG